MQRFPLSVVAAVRWLALAIFCFGIVTVGQMLIFYQVTRWGKFVCPEGFVAEGFKAKNGSAFFQEIFGILSDVGVPGAFFTGFVGLFPE